MYFFVQAMIVRKTGKVLGIISCPPDHSNCFPLSWILAVPLFNSRIQEKPCWRWSPESPPAVPFHSGVSQMLRWSHTIREWKQLPSPIATSPCSWYQRDTIPGHGSFTQSSWLIATDRAHLHELVTQPPTPFKAIYANGYYHILWQWVNCALSELNLQNSLEPVISALCIDPLSLLVF